MREASKPEGGYAMDQAGNVFQSRHMLAALAGSAAATHAEEMRGGSALVDQLRLQALEPYRQRVLEFVGAGPTWNHEATEHTKSPGMQPLMKTTD